MNEIDVLVGASVKRLRLQAGWEAGRFGAATGLSTRELHAVEAGFRRLGASELFHVLNALGLTAKGFFEELDGDPPSHHPDAPTCRPD